MANAAVLAVGFSLGLTIGPAHAGDAKCIWSGVPESYRNDFLAAYPHEGQRALSRLAAPPEVLGPALTRCGITNQSQEVAAVRSLTAYAFTEAVSRWLSQRYNLNVNDVNGSWMRLTPARRQAFSDSVLTGADADMPASSNDPGLRQTAIAVVGEVADSLKVTDPQAVGQIGLYITWKVAMQHYERAF